jgi:hypothetical protein
LQIVLQAVVSFDGPEEIFTMTTRRNALLGGLVLAIAVMLAGQSQAAQYLMSGTWLSKRGPQVVIPINAGAPCNMAPFNGMFCGVATVTAAGLDPGQQLTLPVAAFSEMGGGLPFPIPVPGPAVVQLTTQLDARGPQSVAVFKAGPKTSRFANFAWCPGASPTATLSQITMGGGTTMNPNCLTGKSTGAGAPLGSGIRPGRIRYTAGANQFGGVAQVLLQGAGEVSYWRFNGTPAMQPISHKPFGGAGAPNDQEAGGSYLNFGYVQLMSADITIQTATMGGLGKATTGGVITMPGALSTVMGNPETNLTTGFPFTTGKVQATNPTLGSPAGQRGTTMLTLTGMDIMTANGGRNITLVASAYTKQTIANASYLHLENMTMTIPEPGAVASLASGVALLAILARRSRRTTH